MRALVLNVDYTPLGIQKNLKKIMRLVLKNKATILEYYEDRYVESEDGIWQVPAVFLYNKYVKIDPKSNPSKRSILTRDGYTCQYCLEELSKKGATIDHVKPVSHFRQRTHANTWDNMVACCRQCNSTKADRTPEQAGMKLHSEPGKPRYFISNQFAPKEWRKYL